MKAIDNKELILAIEQLCKENGFDKNYIIDAINQALVTAYKRNYDSLENVKVLVDSAGAFHVYSIREVVDNALDHDLEISLDEAKQINPDAKIGDEVDVEIVPKDFGRIAAVTAKQVIVQKLREAEREMIFDEFTKRKGDLVSGYIQLADQNIVVVDIGKIEGILLKNQMVPTETYKVNDKIRAYIDSIEKRPKRAPQVKLSRSNPNFVKKLMEFEIPEIYEGLIEIKSVSRVPGVRSKVAVYSPDENIDPVGSCVGQKGVRIANVIKELNGEKIDVIEWNEDPAIYISAALLPAEILAVDVDESKHFAQVIVPDDQLLVAIGKAGQNVKLAANLTDWKIDIKSESQFRKIIEEQQKEEETLTNENNNEDISEDKNEKKKDTKTQEDKEIQTV